ncbi:hypothetical protein HB780_02920 (plasmid) [Rhizobium lusitanum]|uniref:hypothetical protein n=1 Tax=Rhizobium lusitanum TaxID=293958 RepID=UPI0016106015|nr:hypothetical protein [Rhizobium lusitanum]QND44751.1 hypothetical protein HB780_02920 [Rhizobium lusitanum]
MHFPVPPNFRSLTRLAPRLVLCALSLFFPGAAVAAESEHIQDVKQAQKSAYVIFSSGSQCAPLGHDFQGWPGSSLLECSYRQGGLEGITYLLDVKAETIATWIETACDERLRGNSACFATVLACARTNSGMMFAVSGNVIENRRNYFFRNGMTVAFKEAENGSTRDVPLSVQKSLLVAPDSKIDRIKSGLTRFWRTLPLQMALAYPNAHAPSALKTQAQRVAWLSLVQAEILAAQQTGNNRLLSAWLLAHKNTLGRGACPNDNDP